MIADNENKPDDNVVEFDGISRLQIPPERILARAAKENFERVLVIGVTAAGEEYFASSEPDGGSCLWDIERAKLSLLRVAVEEDDGE